MGRLGGFFWGSYRERYIILCTLIYIYIYIYEPTYQPNLPKIYTTMVEGRMNPELRIRLDFSTAAHIVIVPTICLALAIASQVAQHGFAEESSAILFVYISKK